MRSYLLSLLLWLEDPLDAVVPPLLPLHWPHCTALHWEHPCTWTCTPSPTSSISETTGQKTNMSQGTSFRHTHVTLGGHGGLRCRPACVCVWRRCVRADGWKRTELCTALRLRAVYVHFDNSLYTVQLPLHGALSLSPPTPPSPI